MSRRSSVALVALLGALPLLAWATGSRWYVEGPLLVLAALAAGYVAGAGLPRVAAAAAVLVVVAVLVAVNQVGDQGYHWVDDTVFFLVVVGGAAGAAAAVDLRAGQVRRLQRLAAELDEQHRVEVAAVRLEEQTRVQQQVHALLAERIAAIAVRAEGARRSADSDALVVLEDEARGVLDQLRAALGSLAPDRAGDDGRLPEPAATERDGAERDGAGPPEPGPRPSRLDLALAGALGAAMAVELAVHPLARGPLAANLLMVVAITGPLVLRRSRPALAAAASLVAATACSAWLTPVPATVTGVALIAIVLYSIGAWCRGRSWLPAWPLADGGSLLMERVSGLSGDGVDGDTGWIVLLWSTAAVLLGRLAAGWQERVRRTERAVTELERGRGAATRLATAEARQALASELHDTVAHAMTVVCLQAGAQRRTGGDADATLHTISSTAAASVAELRDGLDAIETSQWPLDRSRLAAVGRRVGVDVGVDHPAPPASGPAAALAFRVAREAIVNVARHAPGATAEVSVSRTGGALRLEVLDAGGGPGPVVTGTGSGLAGLAEAVRSAGGRLVWGPRAGGGFRVVAEIPEEQS